MSAERGYIAVDRGVFEHPTFAPEPFTEREAWLWMIAEAAWKPTKIRIGRSVYDLARGQLVHSLRFLAARWRWSEARVRRYLARLKIDAMIDALATRDATQITICNYDHYQNARRTDEAESDAPSDALATQIRTKEPVYTLEEINSSKDGDAVADPMGEDLNRRLFSDRVLTFVVERSTAKDAKAARALLGKWKRLAKDDTQALLDTLSKARNQNIADLSAWMPKALAARDEPRATFWRPGMPVAAAQGKPDVFGRTPDHPLYGSSMAV
jgi:hypothetical protein